MFLMMETCGGTTTVGWKFSGIHPAGDTNFLKDEFIADIYHGSNCLTCTC